MLYNIFESLKKQTIIRSFNINQFNPKNVLKQPASPLINQSDPYLHPISDCVVDNEHCETNAHHIVFINQSFNHPINQPLNQSTTQSINPYLHPVVYCIVDDKHSGSNAHHVICPGEDEQRNGCNMVNDHLVKVLTKKWNLYTT